MRDSIRQMFSIPNIPLIEIKPVSATGRIRRGEPAQEFAVFLLKGTSAMMLLLRLLYRWNMDVASPFAKGRGIVFLSLLKCEADCSQYVVEFLANLMIPESQHNDSHGEPEIGTAFDRDFCPHGSYARRRPTR